MSNLKLNKEVKNEDFEVIPDIEIPDAESVAENEVSNDSFVKKQETHARKLFANKKANIAFGIIGGILVTLIITAVIFINI